MTETGDWDLLSGEILKVVGEGGTEAEEDQAAL